MLKVKSCWAVISFQCNTWIKCELFSMKCRISTLYNFHNYLIIFLDEKSKDEAYYKKQLLFYSSSHFCVYFWNSRFWSNLMRLVLYHQNEKIFIIIFIFIDDHITVTVSDNGSSLKHLIYFYIRHGHIVEWVKILEFELKQLLDINMT